MIHLGVNIDHVATLRQARLGIEPEPVKAAAICQASGADSIVAHLRQDRRHINEKDIELIKKSVKIKFNLEMSLDSEIVGIAVKIKPDQVTIVPERRQELTTEGGLNVSGSLAKIRSAIGLLENKGIDVSLFIDPDLKQIDASFLSGAKMIELHTGKYANAKNNKEADFYFKELAVAASYASKKGIKVFAGHGLDYVNTQRIIKIKEIEELNIGYAIVCRALWVGLGNAVREMRKIIG